MPLFIMNFLNILFYKSKLGCARNCMTDQFINVIISFYAPQAASLKHCLRWLLSCLGESHLPPNNLTCSHLVLCMTSSFFMSLSLFCVPSLPLSLSFIIYIPHLWIETEKSLQGEGKPTTLDFVHMQYNTRISTSIFLSKKCTNANVKSQTRIIGQKFLAPSQTAGIMASKQAYKLL